MHGSHFGSLGRSRSTLSGARPSALQNSRAAASLLRGITLRTSPGRWVRAEPSPSAVESSFCAPPCVFL